MAIASAGEIPGLPPPTLPDIPQRAQIAISNDFFGRGGSVDDFRTQQMTFSGRIGERWEVALDHSILTNEHPPAGIQPGRIDQLSASAGYRFVDRTAAGGRTVLLGGGGVRAVGDYGGQRIQNGFHRLFDDRVVQVPYIDTDTLDATGWLRADHTGPLPWQGQGWRFGYWLHGTTLLTTDGQWDGTVSASLTARRGVFDAWLGLRGDWREGYDQDAVQRATADNEQQLYGVLGLRWGPVLLETAQTAGNDAFGRLSFLADFSPVERPGPGPEYSAGLAMTAPDVFAALQVRNEICGWLGCTESGRWRVLGELRYGRPQVGDSTDRFVTTWQLTAAIEREQYFNALPKWLSAYASVGAGWRQESIEGEQASKGLESEAVNRAVGTAEVGLRATTVAASRHWAMRLQAGLGGWLPAGSAEVAFAGGTETLQEPGFGITFGATIEFRP